MYHLRRFDADNGAVLEVDCTITSEGRGCGIYVSECTAWLFADRHDEHAPEVALTDDEFSRLNEEVAECDKANQEWEDR